MSGESFLPEVRYVGPGDNEVRTGAPEYLGGKIYPSNPEAAAALRTFWEEEHKKRPKKRARRPADNNVVVNLARALHERRKAREEKVDTARSKMGPQEEARLEMLIRSESSDEEL